MLLTPRKQFLLVYHTSFPFNSILIFATRISCSFDLYQSNFSIPLVLSHSIFFPSLSKSIISSFYFDTFFFLCLLLYPAIFFALSSSPVSMSLYLSYILSQCVSVPPITSDSLQVFLCVLLLFYYLSLHSLSLCNSNSFLVSFLSVILILHHSLSLPLSLTFSSSRQLSLSLLFTIFISRYPFIILYTGKELYWIFFFLMNLM